MGTTRRRLCVGTGWPSPAAVGGSVTHVPPLDAFVDESCVGRARAGTRRHRRILPISASRHDEPGETFLFA